VATSLRVEVRDAWVNVLLPRPSSYRDQGEGGSLIGLGIAYYHLSQYEKAIDYEEQAVTARLSA
jgi:tetratricopeptide (TPR) repeat protein